VVAIAAGMAITMGALGMLSILARNAVAARLEAAGGGHGAFATASDYGRCAADHADRRGAVLVGLVGAAAQPLWCVAPVWTLRGFSPSISPEPSGCQSVHS
jgi:hypothetical protein